MWIAHKINPPPPPQDQHALARRTPRPQLSHQKQQHIPACSLENRDSRSTCLRFDMVKGIILPAHRANDRRTLYTLAWKVVILSLDIFATIIEKTILADDTPGNSTSLENVVNVFETHVRSFWEEEVGDWNNDAQIEDAK